MKTILIDTSALLYAVKSKLDLFAELQQAGDFPFRVAVLEGTIGELKKRAVSGKETSGKEKRAALLTLALLKAKKISILPGKGNVDDLLAEHSKKGDLVLTQDRELKRRLTKPYLTIRQGKRIVGQC